MTSAPSPVNIAILGAGRQAYVHGQAIVSVGYPAVFYKTYDLFFTSSEKLSVTHPHSPKIASSIEDVLTDPDVHAVIVCTPNNTHAELVVKVAAAGKVPSKYYRAEKSLPLLSQLRYTLRPKAVLRAQLRAKTLGQLELLAMNMRDEAPQPTAYMAQSGTMINDTCVHDFDLARSLIDEDDEFDTVFCHGSTIIDPASCEEAKDVMRVTVNIKTKKGVLFTLNNSRRCATGNDQRVEAQCALGDLRAENHPRNDVHVIQLTATSGGIVQPWKASTAERYAPSFINQIRELTAAVSAHRSLLSGFDTDKNLADRQVGNSSPKSEVPLKTAGGRAGPSRLQNVPSQRDAS
ncbi:hypothetical protein P7C70_g821, partial [Phenoliferia sp. Uapishka_3]